MVVSVLRFGDGFLSVTGVQLQGFHMDMARRKLSESELSGKNTDFHDVLSMYLAEEAEKLKESIFFVKAISYMNRNMTTTKSQE